MRKNDTFSLRRLLALTLALVLVVGLTGCWFKEDPDPTDDPLPPVSNDSTPSTEPSTAAPTAEPTQEPTDAPTEEPTEAPTEDTTPVQTTTMGTVTATKLNIRSAADSGAGVVGSYFKDDRIELLEIKDGWGRTAKGWVNMAYVETDSGNANTNTEKDDEKDDDKTTNKDVVSDGKTTAIGYGVVNLQTLNVRTGPSTDYEKVGTVSLGQRYAYYQKSGNWVRIEKGWISVSYFYLEGTTGDGAGEGKVTSDLNIRSGPDTGFDRVGSYKKGDTVKILTQIDGWGYTSKGWISMKYVEMDQSVTTGTKGKGTVTADALNIRKEPAEGAEKVGKYVKGDVIEILEVKNGWGRTDKGWVSMAYVDMDESTITSTYTTGEGTVTASELNIREKADISSKSVGSYKKGDKVKITEVNGEWGKTDKGWINLKYVKMN